MRRAKNRSVIADCPHTEYASCRGCEYSYDPDLFDGGCTLDRDGNKIYKTRAEREAEERDNANHS